jgi:hypothetical protein
MHDFKEYTAQCMADVVRLSHDALSLDTVDRKRFQNRRKWSKHTHKFLDEFFERRLVEHESQVPILEEHMKVGLGVVSDLHNARSQSNMNYAIDDLKLSGDAAQAA